MATDSILDELLSHQSVIINAISTAPEYFASYIHATDITPSTIQFGSVSLSIPLIPLNDPKWCCLLDRVGIGSTLSPRRGCPYGEVYTLGAGGAVGIPYRVNYQGYDLVAKVSPIDEIFCRYQAEAPTPAQNYPTGLPLTKCVSKIPIPAIRYLASDEFTNETLIAYILNHLARTISIPPLFVRHYQGAICENSTGDRYGVNLMENCDLGPLDKLATHPKFSSNLHPYQITDLGIRSTLRLIKPLVILQILTQITVGLKMLQSELNFTSGDLKAGNIFVQSQPIATTYLQIPLQAEFTCKIADYGKSSCLLQRSDGTGIRVYSEDPWANRYLWISPFRPNISAQNGEWFYTVEDIFNLLLYTRTRHMGSPYYRSFDYYTVICSILVDPAIYYNFFADITLRSLFWDPIWKEDPESILEPLRTHVQNGTGRSINDVLDILKGQRLRCDAVDRVISNLQKYYAAFPS